MAEEDGGSLVWAAARGYEEAGRNSRLVLDLTGNEAPAVEPPPGIEIVTWAERPELADGLWEVAREAAPDIPGEEETEVGELEEWLERDMRLNERHGYVLEPGVVIVRAALPAT